jgi:hypothetical protein
MNDRDIMKLALEALENVTKDYVESRQYKHNKAITALRERLAHCDRCGKKLGGEGDIHTCSPKWVGLTDDGKMFVTPQSQPEQEPVAWQLWVGADTPLNAPMGWQFYSTYNSLKSAEVSARTINSYKQAPFAKVIPLYTTPPAAQPAQELYNELLYAVARVHPNETCHQTALRYIKQAESGGSDQCKAAHGIKEGT